MTAPALPPTPDPVVTSKQPTTLAPVTAAATALGSTENCPGKGLLLGPQVYSYPLPPAAESIINVTETQPDS